MSVVSPVLWTAGCGFAWDCIEGLGIGPLGLEAWGVREREAVGDGWSAGGMLHRAG